MSGWWQSLSDRLSNLRPRSAPPADEVQRYTFRCDCGTLLRGERTRKPQKPTCPQCANTWFIWPRNVYPTPPPFADSTRPIVSAVVESIDVPDDAKTPAAPRAEGTSGKTGPASKRRGKSPAANDPLAVITPPAAGGDDPEQDDANLVVIDEDGRTWGEFFGGVSGAVRRQLTPLRVAVITILIVLGGTSTLVLHQRRVEDARTVVQPASAAGIAAFHERDFPRAVRELQRATTAVDLLGRHDADSEAIRQFHREALVGERLARYVVLELLVEGHQAATAKPPDQSTLRQVANTVREGWLIFDAGGRAVSADEAGLTGKPGSRPRPLYRLDTPLMDGNVRADVVFTARPNAPLAKRLAEGAPRMIFAAQIEELYFPLGKQPAQITLRASTAFLLTDYENYVALGFVPTDEEDERQTRAVLDDQRGTGTGS